MMQSIKKLINKYDLGQWFCFVGIATLIIGMVYIFATNGGAAKTLLWSGESIGIFPDFIESIYDAKSLTPYDKGGIYPALVYCFCYLCGRFFVTDSIEWNELGTSPSAIISGCMLFFTISVLIYVFFNKALKDKFSPKIILGICLVVLLSPSYMYLVERGNLVAVAMILLLFYSFNYKSENKVLRELAYIALACAAVMKIWPAIWGILLLRQKNIRACIHTVVYGVILGVVPFAFMGGMSGIKKMLDNIIYLSGETVKDDRNFGYGFKINIGNYLNALGDYFKYNQSEHIIKTIVIATILVLIPVMLLIKKDWQVLCLLAIIMTILPGFSWIYNAVYFVIPLVFFLKDEKEKTYENVCYLIAFLLIFCIFPFGYIMGGLKGINKISIPTFFNTVGALILLFVIVFENLGVLLKIFQKVAKVIPVLIGCLALVLTVATFKGVDVNRVEEYKVDIKKLNEKVDDLAVEYGTENNISYEGFKGQGSKKHPFIISDRDDFLFLKYCVENGVHFKSVFFEQKGDISFAKEKNYIPIGNRDSRYFFDGIYNGNGYTLSNINCSEAEACVFLDLKGIVANLVVSDSIFAGETSAVITVGEGSVSSAIVNCYSRDCVISGKYAASICDEFVGKVFNCVTNSKCYGAKEAGMLTKYKGSDYNNFRTYGNIDVSLDGLSDDDTKFSVETQDEYLKYILTKLNNYISKDIAKDKDLSDKIKLINWRLDNSALTMDRTFSLKGAGTVKNPYKIDNIEDLVLFSDLVNSGVTYNGKIIVQNKDINAKEVENFTPIACMQETNFEGTYDGKGHVISNLYILSEDNGDVGLFGYMDGTVYNLNIRDAWMGGSKAGLIACHGGGDIINCCGVGMLYGYTAGGISYDTTGKISNCVSFINFECEKPYGISYYSKKISNCFSNCSANNSSQDGFLLNEYSLNLLNKKVKELNKESKTIEKNNWDSEDGILRVIAK